MYIYNVTRAHTHSAPQSTFLLNLFFSDGVGLAGCYSLCHIAAKCSVTLGATLFSLTAALVCIIVLASAEVWVPEGKMPITLKDLEYVAKLARVDRRDSNKEMRRGVVWKISRSTQRLYCESYDVCIHRKTD